MSQSNKALRDAIIEELKDYHDMSETASKIDGKTGAHSFVPTSNIVADNLIALVTNHIKEALPKKSGIFPQDLPEFANTEPYANGWNDYRYKVHQLLEEVSNG